MIQLIYNRSSFLFFALFIFLTVSCGKAPLVDKSMDVNETAWDVKEKLNIDVRIDDTISTFNFYVKIRNTTDYKNSNFFLFIKTTFPNGQIAIDTLECILADNQGKWFGKGNGKIKDSRILLKKNAIFPMKGKYIFEIEHAMREKVTSGIKSIGFRIENNTNK
ncbi:MAG: gliding motility lipoprotein GldH [Bacteroidetes bacterium]|nr:gliding motility lipoprotein GldH [Bacteroidota bacterium]